MSNLTLEKQNELRYWITEYMTEGKSAVTSNIARFVEEKMGAKPSRTTIGIILRDMGYEPIEQPRFIWRGK